MSSVECQYLDHSCKMVGDAMRPSLDGALANPSTGSSRLFH